MDDLAGTKVRLVEVFPRDGLQPFELAQLEPLTTERILTVVDRMLDAGIPEIEITSFAHPKVLPQFANAAEVAARAIPRPGQVLRALVPNVKGLERAANAGLDKVVAFLTCSETYQRKNVGKDVEGSIEEMRDVFEAAEQRGLTVVGGVGTAWVCPYDGPTPRERLMEVVDAVYDIGYREIGVADSIGMAGPKAVYDVCAELRERWPDADFGVHLHNRNGLGLMNVVAAITAGVRRVECSVLGVGAGTVMPVNKWTMGNVATEQLLYLFDSLGIRTGVDLDAVRGIAGDLAELLDITPQSAVMTEGTVKDMFPDAELAVDMVR